MFFNILIRGNNHQEGFRDEIDYQGYLEILKRYKEKYQFKVYHYVLMDNHVHLILEPHEAGGSLWEIMKGINLSYAQYYNKWSSYQGYAYGKKDPLIDEDPI